MINQRTLVIDVESWPLIAAVFGTKKQNIANNQIRQDISLMAFGAKWLGDPASKTIYQDTRDQRDMRDDRAILKSIWKLLDEADLVITQNGKSFDGPLITWRFMVHKMAVPSTYRHIDTYRMTKNVARATSHKLEYLTDKLNVRYKKLSHKNFPGMELWNQCELRNPKAWKEMEKYNTHDVLSTEELYENVKAWAPEATLKPFLIPRDPTKCGACKDGVTTKRGVHVKKTGVYQRYKCGSCGSWTLGEKIS